jgi:hypothetical protein
MHPAFADAFHSKSLLFIGSDYERLMLKIVSTIVTLILQNAWPDIPVRARAFEIYSGLFK